MKKLFLKVLIVFGFLVQSVFADITTGLVAHYGFENNANDSSGNNYNGTTAGALTYSSGKVGQSAIFNGNSSIELPSDVNLSNQSFTISGWFKPNNVTDGMWIMSQGTVAGEYKYLQLNFYNNNFQVDFFNHSASSTGTATTPNQWYYYTVTFDNTTKIATIYLNGVQSGSANMGGSFTGTTPFRIGLYNSTHFYTGEMDEIKIYNRTLSSSDVTALYQATIPPDVTSNLIAHYEFEGNANDSSGNSYNGTYSNFTSGKFGQSASFDGSQSLTINSIAEHLPSGNSARTVSMWVKPSQLNLGHAGNFVSWGNNTIGERYSILHYDTSALLAVASHTGNGYDVEPNYTFAQDQWVHLTVVYNENNVTDFYINGDLNQSVTAFSHATAANYPLYFGSNPGGSGEFYNGQIDEVRIYNRALTSSDVTALYNYTPTPKLTLKAHGGVVQLDGSKDYLLLPAITEVATNHAFTIESLVNLASDGDRFHHIFRQNGDIEYALRFDTNDNQLAFYIRDTNENGGAVTYNLTEDLQEFKDSWHHIAATFDANNLKLYVDGVQKASMAHNLSSLPSISGDAFIGATNQNATDNERFNGLIDEVRIWNTARTQSEIQSNLNQQLDGNETGLVAYYNFDERVGDIVLDIAGKDQNGTIEGNVTRLNFLGDSIQLSGSGSGIETASSLNCTTYPNFSLGAWIKPTDSQTDWRAIFTQAGSLGLDLYNGTLGSTTLVANQWSYVTRSQAGSTVRYYVNGNLVLEASAQTCTGDDNSMFIGTHSNYSGSFEGQIAEASIWKKALTQSEIKQLMVSAPKPNDPNLVGYWPLNDGVGTIAKDYSSNANHGTISGGSWTNTAPIIYGDALYTDYGINSWQKAVALNVTNPNISCNQVSYFDNTTGLFLYSSTSGDTTLNINETTSTPYLELDINVLSLQDVFSNGTGTTNDDVFTNLSNGATIDGGDGNDTLVLSGNKATYTITKNGASYTVTDGTNSYFISNIEYISFNDIQNVAINDALSPKLTLKAHGGAVQFDGTSGYITANSPTTQTNNITMEAWVNWGGSTGTEQYILVNGTGLSNGYGVMVNTENKLRIALSNVTVLDPNVTLTPNEWHHIALTRTNSTWQFYYDGVMTNMTNATYTDVTPADGLKIGANTSGANKFKGIIDEVRVWNIAKTNTQIQSNLNQQLDGNESGLVAYYNFDERVGTKVKDRSVNGYDGTITGNVRRLNFLGDTLHFSSTNNDSIAFTDGIYRPTQTQGLTIGAWSKIQDGQNWHTLFRQNGTGIQYSLRYHTDSDYLDFYINYTDSNGVSQWKTLTHSLENDEEFLNQWHYAAVTLDNSSIKLYYDGVEVNSTSISMDISNSGTLSEAVIGTDYSVNSTAPSNHLLGNVSEVSIWNRPLTTSEIQHLMTSAPNLTDTNLVAYYPLNEGSGTTVYDRKSTKHGTITGATWTNTAPTLYGDTLYTDYGINSWQKLVVENNNTTPTYSLTNSGVSNLNSTSGLFLYSSQIGNTTLNATSSNPNLSLGIDVRSKTNIIIGSGNGTSEDDLFVDTNGNDTFNGLHGNDTVIFTGNTTSYTITKNNDGNFIIVGPNGIDTLINIEYVSFSDVQNVVLQSFNVISIFGNNWLKSSSTPITPAQIGLNFALTGSSQNTILTKIDTNNFVGIQAKIKPIAFGGTASFSMTIDNIISLEIFEKEIKISQTNNNIFDLDNTVSFKDKILYGNIWLSNGKIYANVTDEYQNQIGKIVQMDTNLSSFQNAQFQAKSGNQAFLSVDLQNVSMYETPLMNQVKRLDFLTTQIPASTYEGATEIDSTNVAMYKVATVEDTNHYINKSVTQILKKDGKTYSSNVVLNHKNQLVTDAKTIESGIERKYIEEISGYSLTPIFSGNNLPIEFSSDAKGYKVYEKNQAGAMNETYLLNKTALKELFTNLQMVQYPTKPVTISTLWTYLALPTDINLCIGSYKTSLVDICDQNTTIEAVFGTIDTVYKHQGFWSYWANNKNYSFDKIGLLSSKDGLLVKSEYARTINLPYDITKEISTNLIDFYQKGWYLVHIPFEMSLDEIDTKITAQNKTLKYIFRFKNNTWDIYAPENDNNFPSNITRIQKLNSGDIVWIEVE